MFKMLGNLTKAAVSVAVAVPAAAVDVLMIPVDSTNDRDVFGRSGALLKNAGQCVEEAVKPESKDQ